MTFLTENHSSCSFPAKRSDERVHVRFSNHYFSEGFNPATHDPSVVNDKAQVRQTAEEWDWLRSVTITTAVGLYHVFFELRRTPASERHLQDLNLTVESAYPRGTGKEPAVWGSIGLVPLASKVFKGEANATRR